MNISRPASLMAGISLLTVPTIVYGGLTVLAVVTHNAHGLPPAGVLELTALQQSLFRAGHAHAGVLVILSLVLQVLLDATELTERVRWVARVTAPLAAVLLSAGFFGIAFLPQLSALLWAGATCLVITVLVTGFGLVRVRSKIGSSRDLASLAAAAVLMVSGAAFAGDGGRIEVVVSGVSTAKGRVGCALFNAKTGFPLESEKFAVALVQSEATGGIATCVFESVAPGDAAIAVLHDTNGNGKADTNLLGIPIEGIGVSNNALPKLSAPTFEACRFRVLAGQTTKQAITMRY